MTDCTGDGYCLGPGANAYDHTCPHKCKPVECPNFKVCGRLTSKYFLSCYNGTCFGCKLTFSAKLTFHESIDCPICLENKPGVKQVHCEHTACLDCFKRCKFGGKYPQPVFPYSEEIEDEYDSNPDDPKWINDPLIKKYNDDFKLYEATLDAIYEREKSLRVCGICRK